MREYYFFTGLLLLLYTMGICLVKRGQSVCTYSLHSTTELAKPLRSYCQNILNSLNPQSPLYCQELLERCSALEHITCHIHNNHHTIFLHTHIPIFTINNDYVLLSNGRMSKREWFAESLCTELKIVHVPPNQIELLNNDRKASLHILSLPGYIFTNYTPWWINNRTLWLAHHNEVCFIQAGKSTNLTTSIIQQCTTIFEQMSSTNSKKNPLTIADIRFKDYIIVTKRGNYEKSTIFG